MREPEDQERHDQQKAQQQVQGDHEHVEERLLRRAQVPGQARDAGQVEAVVPEQGEADEDDPEERPQPRPDGRRVDPSPAVPHRIDLHCHEPNPRSISL